MGPQMISPDFVDDALACLRRQGLPTEAVLRAAGLPAAVRRHAAAVRQAVARDRRCARRRILRPPRPMRRGSFTLLCHAVLHAGTLDKALRRALQFLRVVLDEPHGGSSWPTGRRRSC